MLFEQENAPPTKKPTWEEIESALLAIHPKTRSFFVLSGRKSYVQVAGARLRLTIEYRVRKLFSHDHFRVGREPLSGEELSLNYSGGAITVRKSEVLTLEDCLAVFRSFYESEQVPGGYHLRRLDDSLR